MDEKRQPKPYLNVRLVEGLLGDALPITGNRAGLERLRRQIGRALEGAEEYPFHDDVYLDADGREHEAAVKLARSRQEMREQAKRPKPGKTAEALSWTKAAHRSEEERRGPGGSRPM